MKKFCLLILCFVLTACGTIGIGKHGPTNVHNNSEDTITVSTDTGTYKIKPESSLQIAANSDMKISSKNPNCSDINIVRSPNTAALILDIFPGLALGIIPILVDAISNSLYQMPESASYTCMK